MAAKLGDIESESAVTAEIDSEIARQKANLQDIDTQIGKHRPTQKTSWRLTPEQETQARERNAKYLKMAINTTRSAVAEAKMPELVADIIVDERTQIIERAVEEDKADRKREKKKPRAKEEIGPKTRAVLNPPNFKKALQYSYQPWWTVATNYLSTREIREIQKSHSMGNHISTLVLKQSKRIKTNNKTLLTGKLKKYSLTNSRPALVLKEVERAPYTTLHLKDLKLVTDSYKAISENATRAEQETPQFAAAGQLIPRVADAIQTVTKQIQEGHKRVISKVSSVTEQRQSTKRVKVGFGLPRKPRKKRVKRSKSKGKSPKTTSRPSQKEESEPETSLQKWRAQKKVVKKMRL